MKKKGEKASERQKMLSTYTPTISFTTEVVGYLRFGRREKAGEVLEWCWRVRTRGLSGHTPRGEKPAGRRLGLREQGKGRVGGFSGRFLYNSYEGELDKPG